MIIRCHMKTARTFWELGTFDNYARVSEDLIMQARQSAVAECGGDEADESLARAPFDDMRQQLRYASTVFLFSIVETECQQVLTLVGSEQTPPPAAISSVNGLWEVLGTLIEQLREAYRSRFGVRCPADILSRLKKTLKEKLPKEAHSSLFGGPQFSNLKDLKDIRNCIAHANGRVERCRNQKALQKVSDLDPKSGCFRPESKRKGMWCTNEGPIHLEDWFVQRHAKNARCFFQKLFEQLGWPVDECFRLTAGSESK